MFSWSKNIEHLNPKLRGSKRYDFFIQDNGGIIIETHGLQHYEDKFVNVREKSLNEEIENDYIKKEIALNSGDVSHYIEINCSESNMNFIKKNILMSKMTELYDLSSVDWMKCNEYATSSLVKVACNHWNSQIKSTLRIAKLMKISQSTVCKYLKRGAELGWCDYDPVEVQKLNGKSSGALNRKKVVQMSVKGEHIKVWDSARDVERELKISGKCILSVCNGKANTAGGFRWMLFSEYKYFNKEV